MNSNGNIKPTSRVALGRVHHLGEIFDAVEEKFTGVQLFTQKVDKFTDEISCGGNEYTFVQDNSLSQKFEKLNLEAELKMSFMAGLVKVEGSGKYLNESRQSSKVISYTVLFKIRTKRQVLQIFNQEFRNSLPIDRIDNSLGTHIINGITWGLNLIATFELQIDEISDNSKVEGELKAFMKNITTEIGGKAKVEHEDKTKNYLNHLKIKIIGDIMPSNRDSLVTDLEGFQKFLKEVPGLLNSTNNGLGVPLEYNLFPLSYLTDNNKLFAGKLIREINEELLNQTVIIMQEITKTQNLLNDMIEDCLKYESIFMEKLKMLYLKKNEYDSECLRFKTEIKKAIIKFRQGELLQVEELKDDQIDPLSPIFEKFAKSEYYPSKLKSFLMNEKYSNDRKISFFDRFARKDCTILSPYADIDEAFTDEKRKRIFVLFTKMEFLATKLEETNKLHGFFFDVVNYPKYKNETFFYIFDYEGRPDIYEKHGSPELPKIHYYYKRELMAADYFNQYMNLHSIKKKLDFKSNNKNSNPENVDDYELIRNEAVKGTICILVIRHDWSISSQEDEKQLNLFKQLAHNRSRLQFEFTKCLIIDQERFSDTSLFSQIKKTSIMIVAQDQLLTCDFYNEKEVAYEILNLTHNGAILINDGNAYFNNEWNEKFVFFYTNEIGKKDRSTFDHNIRRIKQEMLKRKNKKVEEEEFIQSTDFFIVNMDLMPYEDFQELYEHTKLDTVCIYYYNGGYLLTKNLISPEKEDLINVNVKQNISLDNSIKEDEFDVLVKGKVRSILSSHIESVKENQSKLKNLEEIVNVLSEQDTNYEVIRNISMTGDKITFITQLNSGRLITADKGGSIKIYDAKNNFSCVNTLTGHVNIVYAVIELSDGSLASCSYDNSVIIWDVKDSYKPLAMITGHKSAVHSIFQLKNGLLATASLDSTIKLWDCKKDYQCVRTLIDDCLGVYSIIESSSGILLSSSGDSLIRLWDSSLDYKCTKIIKGHSDCVTSLTELNSSLIASCSKDATIKLWNPFRDFSCVHTLKGHTHSVNSVIELKHSQLLLATLSSDLTIRIWDNKKDYSCVNIISSKNPITSMIESQDGEIFTSSENTIQIWKKKIKILINSVK